MLLHLDERCPIFEAGNQVHLTSLFLSVAKGRHIIVKPSPQRLRAIASPAVFKVFEDLLFQSYKRAINGKWGNGAHRNCGACNPKHIAEFYSLPLAIVLENADTDGNWLKMVVHKLRPGLRSRFEGASPDVTLHQAGGIGEIPKELARLANSQDSVRPDGVGLRIIALADSDAKGPGQPSGNAQIVATAARNLNVPVHILSKRTIENYIPDPSLNEYCRTRADRQISGRHITSLTGAPRDHYPMKDGLSPEEIASSTLYPASVLPGLGMGDFISDLLTNFYHTISAHDLRERDGISELEALLDKIEENL